MHPRTEVIQSGKVRNLDVTESLTYQGTAFVPSAATDEKAKVSSNDTTPGFLNGKLVAGANVTLTENNDGGNETLTIAATFTDVDDKAKVSSNDTTSGFLNGKLIAGTNITFTENNDGGNETLTIAAASGGGVTGFTPSQNTASPNDTVNASRLLVDAATTNADAVLQPKGTGAVLAQLPDSATTGGNKRGANAVDLQTSRVSSSQVATGANSVVIGGQSNTASAAYGIVTGGQTNSVSRDYGSIGGGSSNTISGIGTRQVIGGGGGNTASANYAALFGGQNNNASASYSAIVGGFANSALATMSVCAGGSSNTASGDYSAIFGGQLNSASGQNSVASGHYAVADTIAMRSHASGRFAASGDAQVQEMVVRAQTTSAAQGELTADGLAWTTANTMQVPNDGALAFDILMVARRADANNEGAAWTIRGCIDNNAGVAAFVGTPTTTTLGDDSAGAWTVAADTIAGSVRLRVLCGGQVGKTINWVAHIRATRVVG
jgi:hypothetical protein